MSAPGRISVVIPSHKSRDLLRVVESVKGLNPLEMLVVDSSPSRPDKCVAERCGTYFTASMMLALA